MIKLKYNATYTVNSAELFDANEEQIVYEVWSRQSPDWAIAMREWLRGEQEPERALEIVAMAFVSVSQGGERFPLDSVEEATALRDAIEAQNPGYGDTFIRHLLTGHYNYHFNRLEERLGNLNGSSPA